MYTIALAGNPNTGKTTIFNGLCGGRQQVSNYPGVTVEMKIGLLIGFGAEVRVVDLPGLFNLKAASPDEQIAADMLSGRLPEIGVPDLILFVLDATNLERNLFLYLQVIELQIPVLIALTMTDRLQSEGVDLDVARLPASRAALRSTAPPAPRGFCFSCICLESWSRCRWPGS